MKSLNILTLMLLLISTFSCEDKVGESKVDIEINFKGTYSGSPLVMFDQAYPYEDGMEIRLQLFQFYLSQITLLNAEKGENSGAALSDISLISFQDITSEDGALEGVTLTLKDVPTGSYSGLKMGLGVSSDLNATQPGNYDPGHPLDNHYWSWARGYVFAKIEGNADLDQDGVFEEKLTFHIGENDFYREIQFDQNIDIKEGAKLSLEVDLQKVLVDEQNNFIDFRSVAQDHTNDLDLAAFIMDNLVKAIALK